MKAIKTLTAITLFLLMMGSIGAYEQGASFYPSMPIAVLSMVILAMTLPRDKEIGYDSKNYRTY